MKRSSIMKGIALWLCALLSMSCVAMPALAAGADGNETENQGESKAPSAADDAGISKDETVYVLAGADGSVQKIIVSDWIQNTFGSDTVNDRSELTNIENVKGDETYTVGDDNLCVWDAHGNDIYYQGNTEKELPVDLAVTYKLDGKPIPAEELAGKSGRVTIRFDYQNKQYETVEINGKQEKIYVPFAMLTGLLLNDDVFANVQVSGGKLINDGSRTIVIGIAFPGLQQDLAISEDELEIPDYVEITADAHDFQLDTTLTLATNALWRELPADDLDSFTQLSDDMDELTDAMAQLLDGSSQLYDGISTLLAKSGDLADGITQLADGAQSLKDGAESLDSGAEALSAGATQLSEGLSTLASNNDSLNSGAQQVFDTLLSTANTRLAEANLPVPALTVQNYAQVLDDVIASLGEGAVYEQAKAKGTAAVEANADTIVQQVIALKTSLDNYNAFYVGLQSYTAGVTDAAAGAETLKTGTQDLKTGTSQLSTGASELYEGILTLKSGAPELVNGITQLRDGAMQLSDGLKALDEQGIQRLTDAVNGDLQDLVTRFRAARDVSSRYTNFAGASEDMDGQVKFIYRTDAIEPTDSANK